jgi:hypothetical protein
MKTTITYKGIEFDVEYDYQPEEPMVMYYADGSGYPGSREQIEILNIWFCDADFFELLEDKLDEIANKILENYEND